MRARLPTWQADLAAALDDASVRPFAWWHHDCVTAACRLAGAAMGRNLLAWVVEPWDSASRAARVLRFAGGVEGLLSMIACASFLASVPAAHASRGALVVVRDRADQLCAGCVVGDRVAVVRATGMVLAPLTWITTAWLDIDRGEVF